MKRLMRAGWEVLGQLHRVGAVAQPAVQRLRRIARQHAEQDAPYAAHPRQPLRLGDQRSPDPPPALRLAHEQVPQIGMVAQLLAHERGHALEPQRHVPHHRAVQFRH